MQRRAAAVYGLLFLVLGAASYSLVATGAQPTIGFENPDHRLSAGDSFTTDGQEYVVSDISAQASGGEAGAPVTVTRSGQLSTTDESSVYSEAWANNSSVTLDDREWRVLVPNESDPSEFTLREEINESAILANDTNADNETVTRDGTQWVVVERDGETNLVPASEYFPDPESRQYAEGDGFDYRGNETTVANVSTAQVTAEWVAPRTLTTEVDDEANVTVGDTQYLAHFPNNQTMVLTSDYESYDSQVAEIDAYQKHVTGLTGITIVSGVVTALLFGMAFLPSRY
jgi:hypothetical protein